MVDDPNISYMLNGEIYDYWELRPELEKKYKFRSHSDSEVLGMLFKEVKKLKRYNNSMGHKRFGAILMECGQPR